MSRWWRAYDEAVDDPKLILLGDKAHRTWFNLMCVASANGGVLPDIKVVAVKLRLTVQRAAAALAELVGVGLFDRREDGTFEPHNWNGRQYKSDTDPTAATRSKRYRDKHRDASRVTDRDDNASVTPPRDRDREQNTDTESSLRSDSARKRGARLAEDWMPNAADWAEAAAKLGEDGAQFELRKYRDHWKAAAGQRGVKLDWDATWRNWIRNAKGISHERNGSVYPNSSAQQSGSTAVLAGVAAAAERRARERHAAGRNGQVPADPDLAAGSDPDFFGTS